MFTDNLLASYCSDKICLFLENVMTSQTCRWLLGVLYECHGRKASYIDYVTVFGNPNLSNELKKGFNREARPSPVNLSETSWIVAGLQRQ